MADETYYETVDDVITIIERHARMTTIATPIYGELSMDQLADFNVAARLARSNISRDIEGEPVSDLDFDLAEAISPRFDRLNHAIERAAQARRFNP